MPAKLAYSMLHAGVLVGILFGPEEEGSLRKREVIK
jgi:hypothetical protein